MQLLQHGEVSMPTEQMTIYVPPQVKKALKQLANSREQSINTIVVEALEHAIAYWDSQQRTT